VINYNPADLRPGRTDTPQQQIATPTPIGRSGARLNQIEQRWRTIRATTTMIDPSVNDFLQIDVAHLLTLAHATYAMLNAQNAEDYRKAHDTIRAVLRSNFSA
jgi:hypothetical protein